MRSSFAWDLPRNLTNKRSLFCTKFILKNLYFAENSLYKKPLFLRETARGPAFKQDVSLAAIFSLGDNLHEMSNTAFLEKLEKYMICYVLN